MFCSVIIYFQVTINMSSNFCSKSAEASIRADELSLDNEFVDITSDTIHDEDTTVVNIEASNTSSIINPGS